MAQTSTSIWRIVVLAFTIIGHGRQAGADAAGSPQSSLAHEAAYSRAQASEGQQVYQMKCTACHLDSLAGGTNESPPLRGKHFLSNWDHKPLRALYSRIITTMPSNDPGSLTEKQTLAVLAYLLEQNGFPLSNDGGFESADSLNNVELSAPQSSSE